MNKELRRMLMTGERLDRISARFGVEGVTAWAEGTGGLSSDELDLVLGAGYDAVLELSSNCEWMNESTVRVVRVKVEELLADVYKKLDETGEAQDSDAEIYSIQSLVTSLAERGHIEDWDDLFLECLRRTSLFFEAAARACTDAGRVRLLGVLNERLLESEAIRIWLQLEDNYRSDMKVGPLTFDFLLGESVNFEPWDGGAFELLVRAGERLGKDLSPLFSQGPLGWVYDVLRFDEHAVVYLDPNNVSLAYGQEIIRGCVARCFREGTLSMEALAGSLGIHNHWGAMRDFVQEVFAGLGSSDQARALALAPEGLRGILFGALGRGARGSRGIG